MTFLFVTGMFRSGTTTLARALNAHPMIACASDPMMELLKGLRSDVAADLGQTVPVMAPLADYYYDPAGQALLRALLEDVDLDRPLRVWAHGDLLDRLRARCEEYSQSLVPHLADIAKGTYREVLDSLQDKIALAYGGEDTRVIAVKEVWSNEFVPALARTYPDAKFIVMTRDPRAVCASKNVCEDKYPWTFLARQWRKLAALGDMLVNDADLAGRVYPVRQEDFLLRPEAITRDICAFLGLPWHPSFADPAAYRDGGGAVWRQNTSYGEGQRAFDTGAVERWRRVLAPREVALIERLCGPEMALFGYDPMAGAAAEDPSLLYDPPVVTAEEQAEWMRRIVPCDPVTTAALVAEDAVRASLLASPGDRRASASEAVVQAAFLDRGVMERICGRLPVL